MVSDKAQSVSTVQTKAEEQIVAAASSTLGVELVSDGRSTRISVGKDAHVVVDAATIDGSVVVEAFARQGTLRGAQLKKVAQDILKLTLLERTPDGLQRRRLIVFASPEAEASIRGWVRHAAEHFGVEFLVVDVDDELRDEILEAQQRQVMVNVDLDAAKDAQ